MSNFVDIYKNMPATDLIRHYAYLTRAMVHHAILTDRMEIKSRYSTPPRKGDHGKKKLNAAKALKIYKSRLSHVELARRFNVHHVTISDIKRGRTWNKVTGHPKKEK